MLSNPNVKLFGDGFSNEQWVDDMRTAYVLAQRSPDPSTQNGALLYNPEGDIIGNHVNQFPSGVVYTDERWERPLKYEVIEHAERNSIYMAAKWGLETDNSTMVAVWAACSDCARGIIQAGVRRLVRHKQASERGRQNAAHWNGSISTADMMLIEAGVEIIEFDYVFGEEDLAIRHGGEVVIP